MINTIPSTSGPIGAKPTQGLAGPQRAGSPQPGLLGFGVFSGASKWAISIAPELAKPMDLDVEAINEMLSKLQKAATMQSAKNAGESMKLSAAEQKTATKKAENAQAEAAKKAKEAEEAAPDGSLVRWLTAAAAILGAVVAIAAAISSFGVGVPAAVFAVTAAVLAVTTASMAVADASVKEAGKQITTYDGKQEQMEVSWGGMVNKIVDQQLKDGTMVEIHKNNDGKWVNRNGAVLNQEDVANNPTKYKTAEDIADWKMGWSVAANMIVMLAAIGSGLAAAKAAGNVAKDVAATAKALQAANLERAFEFVGAGVDVTSAAGGAYVSVETIQVANLQADSDRARAMKAFYDTMLKDIATRMKLSNDSIQSLMSRWNDVYDQMVANLAAMNRTVTTTAQNMGMAQGRAV